MLPTFTLAEEKDRNIRQVGCLPYLDQLKAADEKAREAIEQKWMPDRIAHEELSHLVASNHLFDDIGN